MAKKKDFTPKKPWHGSQSLEVRLRIPCDVTMLCKLMDVKPEDLLSGFLSCLAVEKDSKNPQTAKEASIDFFIQYGYGKDYYSEAEIREMFSELARVNDLWPSEKASSKFIEHHSYWRKKYWKHWFKKWYWKVRRKKLTMEAA